MKPLYALLLARSRTVHVERAPLPVGPTRDPGRPRSHRQVEVVTIVTSVRYHGADR